MQVSVLRDLSDVLKTSFENFADSGILKKEFCQEYGKIADVIMALLVHGLTDFHQVQAGEKDTFKRDCIWSIMIPCLSEQGKIEYQLLLSQEGPGI